MKSLVAILTLMLALNASAQAQPMVTKQAFSDAAIQNQADSLKKEFEKEGFVLAKEAGMNMESEYEQPVILPLRQGTWYRIVFVGDNSSRLFEVRMYDWNEKQILYKKQYSGEAAGNVINYDFIPQFSEHHLIKPVQVNKKKKQVGGYFMIFKKTAGAEVRNN
jgi:hypothetical protein